MFALILRKPLPGYCAIIKKEVFPGTGFQFHFSLKVAFIRTRAGLDTHTHSERVQLSKQEDGQGADVLFPVKKEVDWARRAA